MNIDRWKILLEGAEPDGCSCTTVGREYGNGNAIELETGLLLYALVRRIDPTVVVETGTHWGFSSACIASALQDMEEMYPRDRKLHTIDANDYGGKAGSLWAGIGVYQRVWPYIGDATAPVPLAESRPIDFLWLDADHSAEAVIAEWQQFAPRLNRKEAYVGFHDTRLDPREAEGIRRIIAEQMHPIPEYAEIHHLALRNMRGFDLFQLRASV